MSLSSSQACFQYFKELCSSEVEEFWVAALNPTLELIESQMLFRGTVDACPFYPRDLIRFLCLRNASAFVIAHNHPSGSTFPSEDDLYVTRKVIGLSGLLEIPVLDHLIIYQDNYFSFADHQILFRNKKSTLRRKTGP